jgi:hypothetical protein
MRANVRTNAKGAPDMKDILSVSDELHTVGSPLARIAAEMKADLHAAAGGYGSRRARAGGIGRENRTGRSADLTPDQMEPGMRTLPGCETGIFCDGDILGFSTLGAGIDPTVGPGAPGAVAVSPEIQVDSGNASRYQGHYFFWEGRDRANDFEVTPTYLLSATIGGEQQLVGGGGAQNGITSSVFALTDIPLDIGWKRFGDTSATTLRLIMGNYVPGTELDYNFVWWGNSVSQA